MRNPSEVMGETMRLGFFITSFLVFLSRAKGVWSLALKKSDPNGPYVSSLNVGTPFYFDYICVLGIFIETRNLSSFLLP